MVASGSIVKEYGVALPLDQCVQRQNSGFLAPLQTKLAINYDAISTTSTTTIPLPIPQTGKAWIITDMILTHDQAQAVKFALTVGGITVWSTLVHGSAAPDIVGGIETQIDVPQGQTVNLVISGVANMHSYVNISGLQQNIGNG